MQNKQDAVGKPWWSKMVIYWLEDQLSITFHSDLPLSQGKQAIIESLRLKDLNQFLSMRGYKLHPFTLEDIPHVPTKSSPDSGGQPGTGSMPGMSAAPTAQQSSDTSDDLNSPLGKHFFCPASGHGTLVHCFFRIETTQAYAMMGGSVMGNGMSMPGMSSMYGGAGMQGGGDATRTVINLINQYSSDLRQDGKMLVAHAAPNWLGGATPAGTGCGSHGCPMTPPIPVEEGSTNWHINLPDLSQTLQQRTGAGVTVFVLDTRPSLQQIEDAAKRAGNNNTLLQTIYTQLNGNGQGPAFIFNDQDTSLPALLEDGSAMQPSTGRDIFGRLCGFEMPDHGFFVAGIIRDIAPAANIECIRVLNDFGIGTVAVLIKALEDIHNRMLELNPDTGKPGDLYNKPVVINLSLVTMAHQEEFVPWWSGGAFSGSVLETSDTAPLTAALHTTIQSLTALGAVVVGAVGNDSDNRQVVLEDHKKVMHVTTERMLPRYPAAFPEVLAVGAVDKSGHGAAYSNYPVAPGTAQNNGIATYGGGIPVPVFPINDDCDCNPTNDPCPPFHPDCMVGVDRTKLDMLAGVYTDCCYPSLSADDVQDEYKAPNDNGWAYWSGTSFATPIVTGAVARLLEELAQNPNVQPYQRHHEVMRAFTTTQGQRSLLANTPLPLVPEFSQGGVAIGLLTVKQNSTTDGDGASNAQGERLAVGS